MRVLTPATAKERVGFIVPRWVPDPVPYGCQGLPFRALSVAGALYNAGYEVVFVDQEHDLDRNDRREEIRSALRGARAAFIWMSELTPMFQTANMLSIAQMVKAWYPELPMAAGGSFITICPPRALCVDWPIDFFVRGYGEEAACELLAALRHEIPLESVSGLVWRNGTHRWNAERSHQKFRAEDTVLYRHLDLEPFIQRGGIFGNGERTLVVGTARGCAKGCTFCYWSNHEPSLLDASAIVDLVAFLRERYGVKQYHLAELDFFTSRHRPAAMAKLWRERVPDCTWFTLCSPVDAMRLTDAEWQLLVEGGCRKLELGAETGSPRLLQAIGKRHAPEDPLVLSRKLLRVGINPMVNFVFGLYGETHEDRLQTLDLIRRLHALAPGLMHFTFRFFQPAWETPMGDLAIAKTPDYPMTIEDVLHYRPIYGDSEKHAMGWLTAEEEGFIKDLAYYYLPLATSKLEFSSPAKQTIYRGLRRLARVRLRTKFFRGGVDRWLYDRLLQRALDNTYIQ